MYRFPRCRRFDTFRRMAAKKKSASGPSPDAPRKARALEHGRNAYGAKFIKEGFGLTPDDDVAWALGYPYYFTLAEHAGDSDDDLRAAINAIENDNYERASGVASRYARILADGVPMDPNGNIALIWGGKPVAPPGPLSDAEARDLLKHTVRGAGGDEYGYLLPGILEAIVGPDVVTTAIVDALETFDSARISNTHRPAEALARHLAFGLLRVPTALATTLLERVRAMVGRANNDVAKSSPVHILEMIVSGPAAKLRELTNPHDVVLMNDEPFVSKFAASYYSKLDGSTPLFARFLFTGGDSVLDLYGKIASKIRRTDSIAEVARALTRMRSPKAHALLLDLATSSKAKAAVTETILARGEQIRPALEAAAGGKGDAAKTATALLKKLK